ncbi:MAG: UDP-N-acetylmuramoyl-L-alanine--D-glutamate ligase [Candidatus Roizmanbacteria bacterium]|nr:UDP-N-acetylmuramoyl-L-alanine--D-glutamate ligase [Candidatus Roizmanbacteria bacterium]
MDIERIAEEFKNKNIVLVGLGLQGGAVGVAKFLSRFVSLCTVTDLRKETELRPSIDALQYFKNIQFELGEHRPSTFLSADCIVIGPSVRLDMPQLVSAREKGIPIVSEMELFFKYNSRPVIGVTGTRGKTTTTTLIYEMLKMDKRNVLLGGNIPGSSTLSLLEKECDLVLLELSSWQLSGLHRIGISPHIAVFTNFFPDHLNFYSSMDDYLFDKQAIYTFQNDKDHLVVNKSLQKIIEKNMPRSRVHYFTQNTYTKKIALLGDHNRENVSAAFTVGEILGVSPQALSVLSTFKGVSFRLENIETINGVDIYNDTTSTTPIAGIRALEAIHDRYKRIILITGGNSKGLPVEEWLGTVQSFATRVVCMEGTFTDSILPRLDKSKLLALIPMSNLKSILSLAMKYSQPGDAILFSPSATSFAMFKNEFDRGEQFNKIVEEYSKQYDK